MGAQWDRVLRPADLLVLDVHTDNLEPSADGKRLERVDPALPALLTFSFPSQHVAEQAFLQFADAYVAPDPPPVCAVAAGSSRLVFELRDDQATIALTVEGLLAWDQLVPRLAPNALPAGATAGPPPATPAPDATAIEFPYRLLLSPDATGRWRHRAQPFTAADRSELWHTRLTGEDGQAAAAVRAVARRPFRDVIRSSLSDRDLDDLVTLTGDFGIAAPTAAELGVPEADWERWMQTAGLTGFHWVPQPLDVERLMLTSIGASVRMRGRWDYPGRPTGPGAFDCFALPLPSLEQYEHVAGLGRDQFVRVVRRGYVSTGHRASLVKVTERRPEISQIAVIQAPTGDIGVYGSTGYLRQTYQVVIQEPQLSYAGLAGGYPHSGREMPLRTMRLTTLVTPAIDLPNEVDPHAIEERARREYAAMHPGQPIDEVAVAQAAQAALEAQFKTPFWLTVSGEDLQFGFTATDWEGAPVTSSLPLVFIPREAVGLTDDVIAKYHEGPDSRRTRSLGNQSLALADPGDPADPSSSRPGSTRAPVESLTFELVRATGPLPDRYEPRWLLAVAGLEAHVEPVERVLGRPAASRITFAPRYLDAGLGADRNTAGVFAQLADGPVTVAFDGPRGGGLARPNSAVALLSSRQGALADIFAKPAVTKADLAALFGNAKLFGSVSLSDLLADVAGLGPGDFAAADLPEAELAALLADPARRLNVPVLRTRRLMDGETPRALETRFLYKPLLASTTLLRFEEHSELVLDARTVTPLDGSAAQSEVHGELRSFAMDFLGVVTVSFARLAFASLAGRKPDVTAEGLDVEFQGPLQFVNSLRDVLPAEGFSDPPAIAVTSDGISAGYTLGVPSVGVGVFSLQDLALAAGLSIPFADRPAGIRFAISERHHPFLVTVTLFGGGGFFALALSARGVEEIEAAIEFGGNISLNLGVASGGVYVMAGVYFGRTGDVATLTGYLRCGGHLSVLGLINISVEFYLAFTFRDKGGGHSEIWGQASLSVCVSVAFFSKSVTLTVERRFAGASGDPTFEQVVGRDDWQQYCLAYASEAQG